MIYLGVGMAYVCQLTKLSREEEWRKWMPSGLIKSPELAILSPTVSGNKGFRAE
jgi:hypothetical protein